MTEVISIIEHQSLPVIPHRSKGDFALSERHAKLLGSMSSLPSKAYSWGQKCIKWSQYCGLIQLGDITLEILPKIHGKEERPGECRQALVLMLRKAGLMKLHKAGGASVDLQKHTLLDIFILDFCQQLDAQLVQGKLRQYIRLEENLPVLRGKLLSNQQLRHNLAHKERLYCQHDELSEDILINQVIKFTLNLLLNRARSQAVKKLIIRLVHEFDSVTDRLIDIQTVSSLVLNRSEKRFQSVMDACLIFIQGLNPDVVGGRFQTFSLLFDMNRLFESWVAAVLKPVAYDLNLSLVEQKPRKYMAYRADLGREVFQMRPDISFIGGSSPVVIADAKWKLLEPEEAKLGVSQSDLYQMQAYANRYGVDSLILIYPRQKNLKSSYRLSLQGAKTVDLTVLTVEVSGDSAVVSDTGIREILQHGMAF